MIDLIGSVISLVNTALGYMHTKEKRKYLDKIISLEKDYYEAINRNEANWNDARIDNIMFELKLLINSINSEAGKSHVADK